MVFWGWVGLSSGAGATGDLRRDIWIRFDGSGLWVEDQINCGSRQVDRFSVMAPWRLESVHHAGHPVVLTSADSNERGFPVGGNAHLYVTSSLEGRTWEAVPTFPAGWSYESTRLDVHLGPGWKLLAVIGAGKGKGSWLDTWTIHFALSLAGLALLVGLTVSWRVSMALVAGLVLAGGDHGVWPMILCYASFVAAGLAWMVRKGPRGSLHRRLILGHALFVWAVWCAAYSVERIGALADPRQEMSESNRNGGFIDTTDDQRVQGDWPRRLRIERPEGGRALGGDPGFSMSMPDSVDTLVEVEYGELGDWARHRPKYPREEGGVLGGIPPDGATWRAHDDYLIDAGATIGPAPLAVLESHWSEVAASYSWEADSSGAAHPGQVRLLALPPGPARVWCLLSIACFWVALIGAVRKVWHGEPHSISGGAWGMPLALAAVVLSAGQVDASDSVAKAQVVRDLRFSQGLEMVTWIGALKGNDTILRVPLMPGEVPLDPVRVEEGMVVVKVERLGKLPLDSSQDCASERCDSLKSGDWRGRSVGNPYRTFEHWSAWRSRFQTTDSILLRGGGSGGLDETWRVFHSPLWAPEYEGSASREEAFGNPRSIAFRPRSSDWVRIHPRRTRSVEVVRTHLNQARWNLADPSKAATTLDLRLVVAAADTLRVGLPPEAREVEILRNRRRMSAVRDPSGLYPVPLTPGTCAVRLSWTAPLPSGIVRRVPSLTLSVHGIDASVRMPTDTGMWIPIVHGPGFGPPEGWKVGLWGWGLLAMGLLLRYRIWTALPEFVWLWLASSFLTPALALCFPLVVLVHLHRPDGRGKPGMLEGVLARFQGRGAKVLLVAPVLVVVAWILRGFVLGPSTPATTGSFLWFTDVAGPELPRPWMVVLPSWTWAIALAGSLLWLSGLGIRLVRERIASDGP